MIEYRKYIEGEVTSHNVGEYGGKSITDTMKTKMLSHMKSDVPDRDATVREVNNLALIDMMETGVLWTKGEVGENFFVGYSRLGAHKRAIPLIPVEGGTLKSLEVVMPTLELISTGLYNHAILMVNSETGERKRKTFLTNVYSEEVVLNLPNRQSVSGSRLCLGDGLENKAAQELTQPRYGQLGLMHDLLGATPNIDLQVVLKLDSDILEDYLVGMARNGAITAEALRGMESDFIDLSQQMPRLVNPGSYSSIGIHYEINLLTLHVLGKHLPFDVAANAPFHIMTSSNRSPDSWQDVIVAIRRAKRWLD